jgi:hypothetical protein
MNHLIPKLDLHTKITAAVDHQVCILDIVDIIEASNFIYLLLFLSFEVLDLERLVNAEHNSECFVWYFPGSSKNGDIDFKIFLAAL